MKMTTSKQLVNTYEPTSAQSRDNGWKRKLLPGALTAALLAFGCTSANAIEFSNGEWSGSFDTTISYGAIWRAGDLKGLVSSDYVERMKTGLRHWVEGGKSRNLSWGIFTARAS